MISKISKISKERLRALGRAGQAVGREHERKVLEALQRPDRPWWILGARLATGAEDREGIDVVVQTDTGTLFLQVKSNKLAANRWRKRHKALVRSGRAGVVLVRRGDGAAVVWGRTLGVLLGLRDPSLKNS